MKATLKRLAGRKDKGKEARSVPAASAAPSCRTDADSGNSRARTAATAGDAKVDFPIPKERRSRTAAPSACGSSSSSSTSSTSSSSSSASISTSNTELDSMAVSGSLPKPANETRYRLKRPDSPRVFAAYSGSGKISDSSSSSSSISYAGSPSCSMPASEAFWSELPAMKPLVNPGRLQALRLCSRDHRVQDGGDATIMASPVSRTTEQREQRVGDCRQQEQQQQQQQQQQQKQQQQQQQPDAATSQSQQTLAGSCGLNSDCNQCNNRSSAAIVAAAAGAGDANTRRAGKAAGGSPQEQQWLLSDEASEAPRSASTSCEDGRSEWLMAESTGCSRCPIYQYSFRVPDTRANMRAFSDPTDRRVESIARACDSEILLDPEPIRTAASSIRLRRVSIRAPDLRSLEKCCRLFDDKFPNFYASGGLGPGGRCVSKIYDDEDEKYISLSNDECS